jgi:hypothetical protein
MSSTTLDTPFDIESEEGTPPRELLPAGRYEAEATSATYGPTKNGKGAGVSLVWTILRPEEHEKRILFQLIITEHESADAQRFGRQKFKDLCVACNVKGQITELDVLLYKPCLITVSVRKDKNGEYSDRNEITRIMPPIPSWNGARPAAEMRGAPEAVHVKRDKPVNGKRDPLDDEIGL